MERVGGFVELFTQKVPAVCARQKTILPPQAVPLPLQGRLNVSLTGQHPPKLPLTKRDI